jgi:spore coat polysaccharide biosynthesis protein SpsF
MGSKRLPGKSMKFINDKSRLIDFVILNALNSKYLNEKNIFVLTSENKNNLKLIKYLKKQYSLKIIVGSELNVFSRYKIFDNNKDYPILRLTGDNPLIDPLLIDNFIFKFKKLNIDYLTTRGMCHSKKWRVKTDFPKGISLEIFSSKKLFKNRNNFNKLNYQFPTWFFFNKKSNTKIKKFCSFGDIKKFKGKKSFTVDTFKDLMNIKKFIKLNKCEPGKNNFINFCNSL